MKNPIEVNGNSQKVWSWVKEQLPERQDNICVLCGESPDKFHIHHKNGNGLDNRLENLMAICPKCHGSLHSKGKGVKPRERYYSSDPEIRKIQEIKEWYSR